MTVVMVTRAMVVVMMGLLRKCRCRKQQHHGEQSELLHGAMVSGALVEITGRGPALED
jgi:hypothetical protein